MVYPYLPGPKGIRDLLISNKIYVARYWPELLHGTEKESVEYGLASELIPLPVDQRYKIEDMTRIIDIISEYV